MSSRIIILKCILCLLPSFIIPVNIRCQNAENNPLVDPEESRGAPLIDNDDLDIIRVFAPDTSSTSNYPVGSPSANLSVSPLGAAVYTVDIDIPKGIANLQPGISLVYNSQSGNNIAGVGFSLSCLSTISFTPKDLYHDGVTSGITYSWSDCLSLDGRKLVLVSGTHGETGAVYHPEDDHFTTVTLMLDNATGKPYFEIVSPDGMRYHYGKGTGLHPFIKNGTEHYVSWYLSSAIDQYGHTITYDYVTDNLYKYLSQISYWNNTVTFTYEDRTNDPEPFMLGGVGGSMNKRLKQITSKTGTGTFRKYTLGYNTTGDSSGRKYSRLTSVTESNGNNEPLRPLTINWKYLSGLGYTVSQPIICPIRDYQNVSVSNDDKTTYLASDINQDGLSDILQITKVGVTGPSGRTQTRTHVYVHLADKNAGSQNVFLSSDTIICEFPSQFTSVKHYSCFSSMSVTDLDGDGYNDIVLVNSSNPPLQSDSVYNRYAYVLGRDIVSGQRYHRYKMVNMPVNTQSVPLSVFDDFDKDGRTEIFHIDTEGSGGNYSASYIHYLRGDSINPRTGETVETFSSLGVIITLPSKPRHVFSGDFNGDGLSDIAIFCNSGYKVLLNQGGADFSCPFDNTHSITGTGIDYRPRMVQGDFNGDGLPDFLMNGTESANYYFVMCNGDGTFTQSLAAYLGLHDQPTDRDDNRITMLVQDFDHDGKSDLILGKPVYDYHGGPIPSYSYVNTQFWWLRSSGTELTVVRKSKTTDAEDARPGNIITGDFTGDGIVGILNKGNDIYSTTISLNATASTNPEDAVYADDDWEVDMTPIENELSEEEEAALLAQAGGGDMRNAGDNTGTNPDAAPTRDASDVVFHLYKHYNMNSSSGRVTSVRDGFLNNISVSYGSLCKPDVYTKGTDTAYPLNDLAVPLPVVTMTVTDNGAAGEAATSYTYSGLKAHVRGRGLLGFRGCTVTDHTTGTVTSSLITSMDSTRYVPLSSTTAVTIGDLVSSSSSVSTLMEYDDSTYAVYPQSTTETDIYGHQTVTAYTYNTSIGKPTSVRTTYDGQSMYKEQSYASYVLKGGAYLPTSTGQSQKHADASTVNLIITTYEYDDYGKLTRQVLNPTNPQLRKETDYYYDDDGNLSMSQEQTGANAWLYTSYTRQNGRDITSITTYPQTANRSFTYDPWGNVLTESETAGDTLSLITTYTLDGWGNTVSVTSPTGVHTTYRRGWGSTSAKRYYVIEQTEGQPWVKAWYDSRGREVEVESVGPDHLPSRTTTTFNSLGQVAQSVGQLGIRNDTISYTYDVLGRKISESRSTGSVITYSYADRSLTTDDNGRTYTRTFDAWGNVKTSSDPYATMNYTYGPVGKPTYIAMNSIRMWLTYDMMGNRTQLIDPDLGTVSWQYDNNGQVTQKTDGRGKVSTFEYDPLGKRTRETVDGVVTDYVYDRTNHHLLLQKRQGNTRRYVYDNKRRLTAEGTHISGETDTLYTSYAYDSCDRIGSMTLPYGKTVSYTYDDNGYKTSSSLGADTLWRLDWFNGKKEVTYSLNDSLMTVRKYDSEGRLCKSSLTRMYTSLIPVPRLRNYDLLLLDSASYVYDTQTGNLTEETSLYSNSWLYRLKYYTYDDADRLTGARTYQYNTKTGVTTLLDSDTLTYSIFGNILNKTGVGTYTYGAVKPHAVKSVTNPDGLIGGTPQSVTYDGAGKVTGMSEGDYTLSIEYGPEDERWRSSLYEDGNPGRSVRYGDGFDFITVGDTLRRIYYLDEDVILVEEPLTGGNRLYYARTDRQGSYTDIMNGEANRVFRAVYDAWGRQTVTTNTIGFIRGYTGHEMLPEFGLTNMNGRMYDPLLARFLSADDFVQMPLSPQSYNRYSYCMNNPLKYTDPSGELWHLIIGAAAGGVINWLTHGCEFNMKGLGYFGVGAMAGALAAGVGAGIASALPVSGATAGGFAAGFWGTSSATVATSSFWSGAAIGGGAGLVSGFTTGFGNGLIEGNGFGNAFGAGSFEGLLGGVSGGVIGGILGGVDALSEKRTFFNGWKKELVIIDNECSIVGQNTPENCVGASCQSMTGGKVSQDMVRQNYDYGRVKQGLPVSDSYVDGIPDLGGYKYAAKSIGRNAVVLDNIDTQFIFDNMRNGDYFGITYSVSGSDNAGNYVSGNHNVLIRKATQEVLIKHNGLRVVRIPKFWVMDPANGGNILRLPISSFERVIRVY